MPKFLNRSFVGFVEKSRVLDFFNLASTNILVIKMAVNKEVAIPIRRVVANPFMGPDPKINSIRAVSPVVILASKIEDKALLKPSLTDCF